MLDFIGPLFIRVPPNLTVLTLVMLGAYRLLSSGGILLCFILSNYIRASNTECTQF